MPVTLNLWGDGSYWGDGDVWNGENYFPIEYMATQETQCHRLSVKITKTGSSKFVLHNLVARLSKTRLSDFTHTAYVDRVTPSRHLSLQVAHAGSEFILSAIRLVASRKKHQPRG